MDGGLIHTSGSMVKSGQDSHSLPDGMIVNRAYSSEEGVYFHGRTHFRLVRKDGQCLDVQTNDWIHAAHISDEFVLLALMHNRVAVYTKSGILKSIIDCPTHALLYSAELIPLGDSLLFVGGGVMSSVYFWSIDLVSLSVTDSYVIDYHRGSVFRIRSSSDGSRILTTSDDRTVVEWCRRDSSSPRRVFPFQSFSGHLARVWDAVWLGDDGRIASACEDSHIRIFSPSGECLSTLSGHARDVRCLHYSDSVLYSGGEDGSVRAWQVAATAAGAVIDLSGPLSSDWIRGVHFYCDQIVIITNFGEIYLNSLKIYKIANFIITTSAISGDTLFLGTSNGTLIKFNLITRAVDFTEPGVVPHRVVSLFPIDPGACFVANHCGQVAEWRSEVTGRIVLGKAAKLTSFHHDADSTLFGDEKGKLFICNSDGVRIFRIFENEKILRISRIHDKFEIFSSNSEICEFDLINSNINKIKNVNYLINSSKNFHFGFSGTEFLVSDLLDVVQWRVDCGGHRRPFDTRIGSDRFEFVYASGNTVHVCESAPTCRTLRPGVHPDLVHATTALDDGLIVTVCEDNRVRLVDPVGMRVLDSITVHDGSVRAVCRVGDWVVTGGSKSQIRFLTVLENKLKLVRSINLANDDDVRIMGLAGDGEIICAVDSAGHILLIDSVEGKVRISIPPIGVIEKSVCLSVCLGEDGLFWVGAGNGFLLGVSRDGEVQCVHRVHLMGVNSVCPMRDGFIVSVSDDQSIAVSRLSPAGIEVVTRLESASIASIREVIFHNCLIITTGTDRRISFWRFDGSSGRLSLVDRLRTDVTDPLSLCAFNDGLVVAGRGIESFGL
jgi:WD40 repeat protein